MIVLAKPREPDMFLLVPNELEENQSINLLCTVADVESSRETLTIWKISQNNDTPELIYTSDATSAKTENCTEILNVNVTYTVTRDDNGAVFRCSSQNNFTQRPGLIMNSSKISVICMYTIVNDYIFPGFRFNLQCNCNISIYLLTCFSVE